MSKTTFSNKCDILSTLYIFHKGTDNEAWSEFFTWADIGLPLAYSVAEGYATAKPEGKEIVESTWKVFCDMISIDPDALYTSLESAFEASPNPPLADEDEEDE